MGDFETLRNLTLNGGAGLRAIPPGSYGSFPANGGSGFIFGTVGSTEPVVYNLSSLTLNSSSQLQVVGPVILTLGSGMTLNAFSLAGTFIEPDWLHVRVASGGITINSGGVLNGSVLVPTGTVTLNGRIFGNVAADRLIINSSGVLKIAGQ